MILPSVLLRTTLGIEKVLYLCSHFLLPTAFDGTFETVGVKIKPSPRRACSFAGAIACELDGRAGIDRGRRIRIGLTSQALARRALDRNTQRLSLHDLPTESEL